MSSRLSTSPGLTPSLGSVTEPQTDSGETSNVDVAGGIAKTESQIDWKVVDEELERVASFDVVDLASIVVSRALNKGSQNVYNEAGVARFQIAKLKQQFAVLKESICADTLESKNAMILALENANAKKSLIVTPGSKIDG